jgi:ABC-2 type transport system ATP-binding protein
MLARLTLRDFSVTYPAFTLAPLSLEFQPGERVAFVGPNGSGKSTTFRALAGRLGAYAGRILLDGRDLRDLLPLGRRHIGFLPETLSAYGWMTVREHLAFIRDFYPSWDRAYEDDLTGRLRIPLDELMGHLSKGTRIKLSFVAAEAYRPSVLLLDEPTSGLDPEVRRELIDAILASAGERPDRVILFSTHLLEDVEFVAERVILLSNGIVRMDASVSALRDSHPGTTLSKIIYSMLSNAKS